MGFLKGNKIFNLVAQFEEYVENYFGRGSERVFYSMMPIEPTPKKIIRDDVALEERADVPQFFQELTRRRTPDVSETQYTYSDYMQIAMDFRDFEKNLEAPLFREHLRDLIEEKGYKKDSEVYKKSGVSKHVFSKIMNFSANPPHKPSKETVAALCVGLELTIGEAEKFYTLAGYSLTESDFIDKVIRFFLDKKNYSIFEINSLINYYNETDKPSKPYPFIGEQARE